MSKSGLLTVRGIALSTVFMTLPLFLVHLAFQAGTFIISSLVFLGVASLIYACLIWGILSLTKHQYDPYVTGASVTTVSAALVIAVELLLSNSAIPPYFFIQSLFLLLFMGAVGALGALGYILGSHPELGKGSWFF